MPPRTRVTMGMDTPASNDDIEYEPTTTPGPPGPTTTDTLIQMMMEYMRRQREQIARQNEQMKMLMKKLSLSPTAEDFIKDEIDKISQGCQSQVEGETYSCSH
ncbi:protein kinase [Histoplasma ohiense]|nr:protein kinase [Histoplasma ohiense (nom. inval.)]